MSEHQLKWSDAPAEQQRDDIADLLDALSEFSDLLDKLTHGGELALPNSFDGDIRELEVCLRRLVYRCRDEHQKLEAWCAL